MKRTVFVSVVAILLLFACAVSFADERITVSGESSGVGFQLVNGGKAAAVIVDENDYPVVKKAAADFASDVERVSGTKPALINARSGAEGAVIAGTLGKSAVIDRLVKEKSIDVSAIEGQWESFMISVVEKPLPGIGSALVIAGSDRRGTAFGIYEMSRLIGVSPWNWWADVPSRKMKDIFVNSGAAKYGPPSVKYRGIFLNDEDYGLKPWASKTYEPETGDIGPKTYARIFELLLRLKANFIWPAMHDCTRAFNHYPENKRVADEYAIVMGSSHCEQMLRNNVDEWKREERGEWNYIVNRENVLKYWEERLIANGKYENIYTLGMRGIHDSGMEGEGTLEERTRRIERIIADQRELLRKHVNPDPSQVPQIFVPYKEVLALYRNNMQLPDDITLMWVDDNFQYIRQLSGAEERKRSGGSGVYYHISYKGGPHDYLWLCTTPPALIWEEMRKAWDFDARRVWVVNVGDIKPGEIGTDFFLRIAWDIDSFNADTVNGYLRQWAAENFGPEHAEGIASLMSGYYLLNSRRKPENMGFELNLTGEVKFAQRNAGPFNMNAFSAFNYGDEIEARIDAFEEMEKKADAIRDSLSPEYRDAFFQLIGYPVKASAAQNRKVLNWAKNTLYAGQKRVSADLYGKASASAFEDIKKSTAAYNETTAGGKWRLMMHDEPYENDVFKAPQVKKADPETVPRLGVALEGSAKTMTPSDRAEAASGDYLPEFNRFTKRAYFIDLFNYGAGAVEWKAEASAPWIRLDRTSGVFDSEQRILASIDYAAAPAGDTSAGIVISGPGGRYVAGVAVHNPAGEAVSPGEFVQDNGVVSIEAAHYNRSEKGRGMEWTRLGGLGRVGAAMLLLPFTADPVPEDKLADAPRMEYIIHVRKQGKARLILNAVPTHEIVKGRRLVCAVSLDDGPATVIEFKHSTENIDLWRENVLANIITGTGEIELLPGRHVLKVWGMDSSVVLEKITVNIEGMKKSYMGPPETIAVE